MDLQRSGGFQHLFGRDEASIVDGLLTGESAAIDLPVPSRFVQFGLHHGNS